ncbi:hypothetical protein Tco_0060237 [Tanacetum coccineum]
MSHIVVSTDFFCILFDASFLQILLLWTFYIKIYASYSIMKTEIDVYQVWQNAVLLRAFSLFLLAFAASEVFGADTEGDAGSVVVWFPLVIMSHSKLSAPSINVVFKMAVTVPEFNLGGMDSNNRSNNRRAKLWAQDLDYREWNLKQQDGWVVSGASLLAGWHRVLCHLDVTVLPGRVSETGSRRLYLKLTIFESMSVNLPFGIAGFDLVLHVSQHCIIGCDICFQICFLTHRVSDGGAVISSIEMFDYLHEDSEGRKTQEQSSMNLGSIALREVA